MNIHHWRRSAAVLMAAALLAVGAPTAATAARPAHHHHSGWTTQQPMVRGQGGLATVNAHRGIFTFGGFGKDFSVALNTVQRYDVRTRRWRVLPSMPTARGDAAAAATRHRIFVIGGYDPTHALSTVEVLNLRTHRWHSAPPLPEPRAGAAAVAFHHRIYVIGGYDRQDEAVGTVEVYNTRTRHWSSGPSMDVPRGNLRATIAHGRAYAVGGGDTSGAPLRAVEVLALRGCGSGSWHSVASLRSPREGEGLATGRDGRLYAVAGVTAPGTISASAERYTPWRDRWTPLPSLPAARARAGLGAARGPHGTILAIGGFQVVDGHITPSRMVDALQLHHWWWGLR